MVDRLARVHMQTPERLWACETLSYNINVYLLSTGQSCALLHHLADVQLCLRRWHDSAPSTKRLKVS